MTRTVCRGRLPSRNPFWVTNSGQPSRRYRHTASTPSAGVSIMTAAPVCNHNPDGKPAPSIHGPAATTHAAP
ncbi:hypothetical protein [Nocardia brasiliensis]|uniref:hypothetical protein n=1 Tax=Nocardia brasiliensis TaxID=37326 RepID=UPI0018940DD9|nr:hypothetical protein [Nocardia brasiliensis]MBF6544260.1 hypothetical protein [Nocardia brasiliensis]